MSTAGPACAGSAHVHRGPCAWVIGAGVPAPGLGTNQVGSTGQDGASPGDGPLGRVPFGGGPLGRVPLGPGVCLRRRRRFARRLSVPGRLAVHSGTIRGKGSSHSLPLLTYSAPGGLRQGPGRAAESSAGARNLRKWGSRRACVVVDVWHRRGHRTAGGTRGAVAGNRRRGADVRAAAAGVAGPAVPTSTLSA
jgi:hypothetical protein